MSDPLRPSSSLDSDKPSLEGTKPTTQAVEVIGDKEVERLRNVEKHSSKWTIFAAGAGLISDGLQNNIMTLTNVLFGQLYGKAYTSAYSTQVSNALTVGTILGQVRSSSPPPQALAFRRVCADSTCRRTGLDRLGVRHLRAQGGHPHLDVLDRRRHHHRHGRSRRQRLVRRLHLVHDGRPRPHGASRLPRRSVVGARLRSSRLEKARARTLTSRALLAGHRRRRRVPVWVCECG